jgi:hypothetical protein
VKRTLATVALVTIALCGLSAHADGAAKPRQTTAVQVCETALLWADSVRTEARADRAVEICGMTVVTETQAKKVYAWSKGQSAYVRDLIG